MNSWVDNLAEDSTRIHIFFIYEQNSINNAYNTVNLFSVVVDVRGFIAKLLLVHKKEHFVQNALLMRKGFYTLFRG